MISRPAIITLDSLGLGHPSTARNLKDYLQEEGRAKRGFDVDIKDISGVTAKDIPLQSNFCDCGLYLLGYMDKFLENPRRLIYQLLQREPQHWPKINSSDMRIEIRDLLLRLYEDQQRAVKAAWKDQAKREGKYHERKGEIKPENPHRETKPDLFRLEAKSDSPQLEAKPDNPQLNTEPENPQLLTPGSAESSESICDAATEDISRAAPVHIIADDVPEPQGL